MDQSLERYNKDFKFLKVFSAVSGIILALLAVYIISQILGLLFSL